MLEWFLACFKGNIYSLSFYCRLSTNLKYQTILFILLFGYLRFQTLNCKALFLHLDQYYYLFTIILSLWVLKLWILITFQACYITNFQGKFNKKIFLYSIGIPCFVFNFWHTKIPSYKFLNSLKNPYLLVK